MVLNNNGVVFHKDNHTYFLNGKELHGITGVIQRQLFPDKYSDVPESVLIRAAERGTDIHEIIEMFDDGFAPTETTPELESYKRFIQETGYEVVESEYTVTDFENYASNIDKVFVKDGNVILGDIKTTYKPDDEYCRWQLSIYAYMFELCNPGLSVSELRMLWMRGEKSSFKVLERIGAEECKELLNSDLGGRQFHVKERDTFLERYQSVEMPIVELERQIKVLTEKRRMLTDGLLKLMQETGVKSYKGERLSLTRKAASKRECVDATKLKSDYPEVWDAVKKMSDVKESLTIKII